MKKIIAQGSLDFPSKGNVGFLAVTLWLCKIEDRNESYCDAKSAKIF